MASVYDTASFTLIDEDQFTGGAIDNTRWSVYNNSNYGSPTRIQTYMASNVIVGTGSAGSTGGTSCKLRVIETDNGSGTLPTTASAGTRYSYTAGMLDTQTVGKFYPLYTKIEWRARLTHGQGIWQSFWLTCRLGGADTCEVDVVEYFHSQIPGKNSSTIHGRDNSGVYSKNRYTNNGQAANGVGGRTFFEAPTTTPAYHTWSVEIVPVTDATGNTEGDYTKPSSFIRFIVRLDGVQVWRVVDTSALYWSTNGGSLSSFWQIYMQGAQVDGNYVGHPEDTLGYSHWLDQCLISGSPGSCAVSTGGYSILRPPAVSDTELDYQRVFQAKAVSAPAAPTGFAAPSQIVQINAFGTAAVSNAITATTQTSLVVVTLTNQLSSGNATSVTDNVGNTYTRAVSNTGTSQRHEEIWYCLNAAAGITSVTVNNSASTNVAGFVSIVDGGASAVRTSNSAAPASTTTPANAPVVPTVGDIIFGGLAYQATVASTTQETLGGTGWTSLGHVTRGTTTMAAGAYKIATDTTSQGPTWTMSASIAVGEATVAFAPPATPLVSVSSTRSTGWNALETITTQRTSSWGTLAKVAQVDRGTTWKALASLTVARSSTWTTYASNVSIRSTAWNTLKSVSTARATSWNTASTVSQARATSWAVAVGVAPAVQLINTTIGSSVASTNATITGVTGTAGNGMVLFFARSGGTATGAITGITDTAGNTWYVVTRGSVSGQTNTRIEQWQCDRLLAAPGTITVASGTSQTNNWHITEWTGLLGGAPIVSADNSGNASSTVQKTPDITPAVNNLCFAAIHFSTTTTTGPDGSWIALTDENDSTSGMRIAYQVARSASVLTGATWNLTAAKPAGTITTALPASSTPTGLTSVTATRATTWATLSSVATASATTWAVLTKVTATRSTSWTTVASVTATRNTTWNVAGSLVSVSAGRGTSWNVAAQVTSARSSTWTVSSQVTSVRPTTWTVRTTVTTARGTSWNTLLPVSVARTSTWSTLASATLARSTTWVTKFSVQTNRQTTWNALQTVTASRNTSWTTSISVARSASTSWVTFSSSSAVRSSSWTTKSQVTAARATAWDVALAQSTVSKSASTSWNTFAPVTGVRNTSWTVRTVVVASRSTSWKVDGRVTSSRLTLWATLRPITKAASTTWIVRATVQADRTTNWITQSNNPVGPSVWNVTTHSFIPSEGLAWNGVKFIPVTINFGTV